MQYQRILLRIFREEDFQKFAKTVIGCLFASNAGGATRFDQT